MRAGAGVVGNKAWQILAVVVALSLLAAACSSDDDASADTADAAEADAAETDAPDEAEEAAEEPEAIREPEPTEEAPTSDEPFRGLAMVTQSGPVALLGASIEAGLRAAQDIINEDGGINGQQVELTFIDDAGDPTQAVTVLQEAIADDVQYDFVFTGAQSTIATPSLPILADYPAMQCATASGPALYDPEAFPNHFGSTGDLFAQEGVLGEYAAEQGYERAVVFAPDNESGRGSAEVAAAGFEGESTVVLLPTDVVDATPFLQQAQDFEPDVFFMASFFGGFVALLEARGLLGLTDIPVVGDLSSGVVDFGGISDPSYLDNVVVMTNPFLVAADPATETEVFQRFYDTQLQYDPDVAVGITPALYAYDCLMLARAAAEAAGATDGPAMVEALALISDASQVEGWIGSERLFDPARGELSHYPDYQRSDFLPFPAGSREGGLMVELE